MLCICVTRRWTSARFTRRGAKNKIWAVMIICFLAASWAGADEVMLVGGDVLHGKIIGQSDLAVVLEHSDLGRIEISRERIRSMTFDSPEIDEAEEPSKEAEIKTQQQADAGKTEKGVVSEPEFTRMNDFASRMKKKGWSFSADFSLDNSSGNTDERSLRVGLDAKRVLKDRRLAMDLSYFNKVSEDSTTDNKLSYGLTRDWLNPESPWFYFAMGRFDYDEFESWQERAAGHIGPGYHLIKSDKVMLDLRAGAGARKEWGSENDKVRPEGLGGVEFSWQINSRQRLNASSFVYPVLSDTDDFRTRTSMDWRFLLEKELKMSFLVGLLHEYQSIVDPDKDKNDLRIYTGIRYEF